MFRTMQNSWRSRPAGYLFALVLLLQASATLAHPPGLSSVELTLKTDQVLAKVTFALQDIEAFAPMDSDLDAEVSNSEREAAKPAVARLLAEQLRINIDGNDVLPDGTDHIEYDEQNNARVELVFTAKDARQVVVQAKFLTLLPEGHQQFVTVRDANGRAVAEKMLHRSDDSLTIDLAAAGKATTSNVSPLESFIDFLQLGIEHIVTGYDHLLFLFALLAVTHSFWPAIKIITFFTIAHSITLAMAGLNVFDLPSSFVEPFIAATIVYVAVENVIRGDHPHGRHWLTFGFGLIHGFGFAGVLRELDITSSGTGILLPLLSFNLGIETGQIAVAAIALPLIWQLNNRVAVADKFLRGGSVLIALVGAYWFLERTVL